MLPFISFVVCTHNGSARLARVLTALATHMRGSPGWELVVVENGSTDDSGSVVLDIWDKLGTVAPLRLSREDRLGLMWARIRGARDASGEVLCFIDDDNFVMGDWASIIRERFSNDPELGILGANGHPVIDGNGDLPDWFHQFASCYAVGPQGRSREIHADQLHVYGAGMSIRRDIFMALLDFDVKFQFAGRSGTAILGGDDAEICCFARFLGWRLGFDERLQFGHLIPVDRLNPRYMKSLAKRDAFLAFQIRRLARVLGLPALGRTGRRRLFSWRIVAAMRLVHGVLVKIRPALQARSVVPLIYGVHYGWSAFQLATRELSQAPDLEEAFVRNRSRLLTIRSSTIAAHRA